MVPSVPNSNNLVTIKNELLVLNLLNKELSLNSPELIIVANRIEQNDNFKELSNEEKEKKTFYDSESNINEHINRILDKNLDFHYIIQWNMGLKSTKDDFNLYWKTIEKICEITSKKSKNKKNYNNENLVYNFQSTIEILENTGIMNSTNFSNSEEVFDAFYKYKLDKTVEEEKQDKDKIYENLIEKTINDLTDEQILEMIPNNITNKTNETSKVFFEDFEEKCNKIINENIIRKLPSIKNKKDKFELIVKEIYGPIYQKLIKKGIVRLNIVSEKLRKEGKEELSKEIANLKSKLEDMSKKLDEANKKSTQTKTETKVIEKEKDVIIPIIIPIPCSIF